MNIIFVFLLGLITGLGGNFAIAETKREQGSRIKFHEDGKLLGFETHGLQVRFRIPDDWARVWRCSEVPMNAIYEAGYSKNNLSLGVTVIQFPKQKSNSERIESIVGGIQRQRTDKVRVIGSQKLSLSDGRVIEGVYVDMKDFPTLLVLIPEIYGGTTKTESTVLFEFSAPSMETLKASSDLIQTIVLTYSCKGK